MLALLLAAGLAMCPPQGSDQHSVVFKPRAAGVGVARGKKVHTYHGKAERWTLPDDKSVEAAIAELRPYVEWAEPSYTYSIAEVPNDGRWPQMWSLPVISAPLAWDKTHGSLSVIVADIDTGVYMGHEDLTHIWRNADEVGGNGLDDDGNGFIDDVVGWDFWSMDNDPRDEHGHGTHTTGTCCATTGNVLGMSGVAWDVTIMPLRGLGPCGSGQTADLAEAIEYAADNGANIITASWGGGGFAQVLMDALTYAKGKGVLFVCAAGNNASDNDVTPFYPASYQVDNIIAVASSDINDGRSSFSNYGATTVHLAAPGSDIVSSWINPKTACCTNTYAQMSGTSMATPHVAGVAALVKAVHPEFTYLDVKKAILDGVDKLPQWAGVVVSGGRLNAAKAVGSVAPPPTTSCGDGICQESCNTCPADCSGRKTGKPSKRYCCGDGTHQAAETASLCDGNF